MCAFPINCNCSAKELKNDDNEQDLGDEVDAASHQRRLRIIDPATGLELGLTGEIRAAQGRWLDGRHSSRLLLIMDPVTGTFWNS